MNQKFKIPVYLILKKDIYDETNEYAMVGYSFDKDTAMGMLREEVIKVTHQRLEDITDIRQTDGKTWWNVGNQIFELEEREITV